MNSWFRSSPVMHSAPNQVLRWWRPPVMWTLVEINPINTIVISTINHSYWSYVHQLSYRLGGPSSSLALQFLWVVPDPAPWSHWNWCSSKLNARGPRLKLVAGLLSWCLFPFKRLQTRIGSDPQAAIYMIFQDHIIHIHTWYVQIYIWLVVYLPSEKYEMGRMTSHIWNGK